MSKGEAISKMRSLNILLVLLTCAASLWAWVSLPDLLRYPVHWNIHGEADAFGSKGAVFFILAIMPVTAMSFQLLLWWLTTVDSVKEGLAKSGAAYDIIWHGLLWVFLVVNIMIAVTYMSMLSDDPTFKDMKIGLRIVPITLAVFFIIIGNVLPKIRQNKFVGVRTPWTLKSDMTWEATHRVAGRAKVGAGILALLAQFFTSPEVGLFIALALLLGSVLIAVIYSYSYYQSAVDRPS